MKMEAIALVIPADQAEPMYEVALTGGLDQLQTLVGGYIEALPLPEFTDPHGQSTAYVNEEGKLLNDPINTRATDLMVPGIGLFAGDYIAGTFVIAGFDPETGDHTPRIPDKTFRLAQTISREATGVDIQELAS